MNNKINEAFLQFDNYNKQDPHFFTWQGETYPQEYFLATKLHEWVLKLDPTASDALLLASRSQHIGRWESPRSAYPMDKTGYLKWRKDLSLHHAKIVGTILEERAFSNSLIEEVLEIIQKKKIKVNPTVQTMENALCLVFLEFQYEDFFPKHTDKIVNILKKSLLKMDAHGHAFALSLPFSKEGLHYIQEALSQLTSKNTDNKNEE